MGEALLRIRTAALVAGAALFVVACGGNKPAEAPADTMTTEAVPEEAPMDMAPMDATAAEPAADAMAEPADPMAPAAEAPAEAPAQ